MTRQEFEQRTGIYPSSGLFNHITKAYMDCDLDKDAFCKAYKANKGGIARSIALAADMGQVQAVDEEHKARKAAEEEAAKWRKECAKLRTETDKKIETLKKEAAQLRWKMESKMQQWNASGMSNDAYERLAKTARELTDEEAAELIAGEFGFNQDCVKIVREIEIYETTQYRVRATGEKIERNPVYCATDYYYIRFDVACSGGTWCYEAVDGELIPYNV